jgi:hypothetical protein
MKKWLIAVGIIICLAFLISHVHAAPLKTVKWQAEVSYPVAPLPPPMYYPMPPPPPVIPIVYPGPNCIERVLLCPIRILEGVTWAIFGSY